MTKSKEPVNETRPWKCPVCPCSASHGSKFMTSRELAMHIAMKWDGAHTDWRLKRNIQPSRVQTMQQLETVVTQIIPRLRLG